MYSNDAGEHHKLIVLHLVNNEIKNRSIDILKVCEPNVCLRANLFFVYTRSDVLLNTCNKPYVHAYADAIICIRTQSHAHADAIFARHTHAIFNARSLHANLLLHKLPSTRASCLSRQNLRAQKLSRLF